MRYVDGDLKKVMDELNDVKNTLGQLSKGKDSPSYLQKDLGDIIYNSNLNQKADIYFVEKHQSEILATCIAIVHKTKLDIFLSSYELLIEQAVIPRSAKQLEGLEDKDGNVLYRFVVLTTKVDQYLAKARNQGYVVKRFQYNFEKYQQEQASKTSLETKIETLKVLFQNNS